MSNKIVCDACGELIDTSQPYYTGSGQKVQTGGDGGLIVVEESTQFDFHAEHVPWTPDGQPAQATQLRDETTEAQPTQGDLLPRSSQETPPGAS